MEHQIKLESEALEVQRSHDERYRADLERYKWKKRYRRWAKLASQKEAADSKFLAEIQRLKDEFAAVWQEQEIKHRKDYKLFVEKMVDGPELKSYEDDFAAQREVYMEVQCVVHVLPCPAHHSSMTRCECGAHFSHQLARLIKKNLRQAKVMKKKDYDKKQASKDANKEFKHQYVVDKMAGEVCSRGEGCDWQGGALFPNCRCRCSLCGRRRRRALNCKRRLTSCWLMRRRGRSWHTRGTGTELWP